MPVIKNINGKGGGGYKSEASLRGLVTYAIQPGKTEECKYCYVTGTYLYDEITTKNVVETFMDDKRLWNKLDGSYCSHVMSSFSPDDNITPEQAFEFGKQLAERIYPNHQCLIAVHVDKKHLHVHIIANSVAYDTGLKINEDRKLYWAKRRANDELGLKYGIEPVREGFHRDGTPIEKGTVSARTKTAHQMITDKPEESWMLSVAQAVTLSASKSTDRASFIALMDKEGWKVNWSDTRKHITFESKTNPNHKVRNTRLAKTFHLKLDKEDLENEFERVARMAEHTANRDAIGDIRSGMEGITATSPTGVTDPSERLLSLRGTEQEIKQRERSNFGTEEVLRTARQLTSGEGLPDTTTGTGISTDTISTTIQIQQIYQKQHERTFSLITLTKIVIEALLKTHSVEGFIQYLERNLWKVTWTPKQITFESQKTGHRFTNTEISSHTGRDFSVDSIGKQLAENDPHKSWHPEPVKEAPTKSKSKYHDDVEPWKP